MAIKPLQMPDLSQLPDPTKDMFGGMTSPTALMNMGDKQVNDLLNPKPLFEQNVKLSTQAQQTINGIAKQQQMLATETDRAEEKARHQQQEAVEAQIKASQNQVKENERYTQKLLKAQEEARKKKVEEQGGKLGAGADGSFVLRQHAKELIKKAEWKRIVSNLQRDDEMEMWLKQAETKLREAGVSDESVIKAELDVARNVISGDTKSYIQRMKEDNIDPTDLVSSLGKGARTIYRGAGIMFGASDEWAKNEKDAIDSINSTYSDTMLLDQANYAYQRSKTKAQNPDEGVLEGFASGAKDAWNSGNVISSIVDTAGYVPYAVVGTSLAAKGIALAGATTGLTGLTTTLTGKAAATSSIGGRIVSGILSAETGGAAAATGLLAATDAASGAYDNVMALDFNDKTQLAKARQTYIAEYGQANWDSLVADNGGDMNKVKSELAIQAGRLAGSTAFVTTAPLGVFGLEATLAKMGTHGMAAQAGKRVLTVGANAVSETLEEGFTQLSQNVGAKPVTGVSLIDDVGATAAMGAIAGGGMAAGTQAIASVMDTRSARMKPTFDINELDPNRWVSAGNINYDAYRTTVGHQMDNIARDGRRTRLSEDDIQQLQQRTFNDVVDNNEIWSRMTPEQQVEFKDYLRLSYNINSNGYARFQETAEAKAWASNDYAQINNAVVDNPLSMDLLNAYRVKNNVELEQVPQNAREYSKTLADVLDAMATQDTNVTTQERELQSMQIIADKVKGNDKLTDIQKRSITAFMINHMDAGSRRMTDEQQAAYNRVQQAARQVQANQQVNQNGTQEQNQTSASQPAGQGTVTENAGAVAPQGSTNGAGTSGTLNSIAEELATVEPTGQGSNNTQGVGNDLMGQAIVASSQTDNTATSGTSTGGNGQGFGQTPPVGNTQSTTTPASDSGQTTQQGTAGQTSQGGQPLGQTRPSTTQTPVSGGSVGVTPSERDTDGGSQQVITQADVNDSFIADPANETYVKSFINVAYNDLGKFGQGVTKHKADLRRLAGITGVDGGKLSEEHIDKLYDLINMPSAARTTLINNEFRTQAAINRVYNAVHHLKQNTIKAIKVDIKVQEREAKRQQREAEKEAKRVAKLQSKKKTPIVQEQPLRADVIDLSDVGIPAVSIPYTRKEFIAEGRPLRTVSGSSQIIVYNDRPIVIVTINGINVPFYRSTGKGGKTDVQANKWYPFFGIGSDGWINKTSGSTGINDYYGSDALRQMANMLDTSITEDMLATARSQTSVGTPATSQATYDLINQVFPHTPTDLGKANALKTVEANIAFIVNSLGGSTQTTTEQQVALLGYQSVEQAQAELVPLVNNYQVQTVEQVQELTNVLATTMGVPVSEVKQYLLDSQLVDETFTGDIIDMVYDEANDIWVIADIQTERQGLPYASEQTETNERPRTQAIGSTNYRQISFSEPSATPTPEAPVGTDEVTTADGATFNLQEILSGVTNKRIRKGEVPPTLNDLAPEDDTADRPTIELTINGQTHTGKLYRFRKGNRRYIAFVHDGNAYGMKAVQNGVENQDWINFGAGVGTKRVDSINAQTAIRIRVLDATPAQQDLFNQPQEQNAPPIQEIENENTPSDAVSQADIDTAYADYAQKPSLSDVSKFTTGDGTVVLLEYESGKTATSKGVTTHYFKSVAMNGDHVGDLSVHDDKASYPEGSSYEAGSLVVKRSLLDSKYQRKGIGKAIYNFAEEKLGVNILPSATMTPAAQAMWSSWKGSDWLNQYGLTADGDTITSINQQGTGNEATAGTSEVIDEREPLGFNEHYDFPRMEGNGERYSIITFRDPNNIAGVFYDNDVREYVAFHKVRELVGNNRLGFTTIYNGSYKTVGNLMRFINLPFDIMPSGSFERVKAAAEHFGGWRNSPEFQGANKNESTQHIENNQPAVNSTQEQSVETQLQDERENLVDTLYSGVQLSDDIRADKAYRLLEVEKLLRDEKIVELEQELERMLFELNTAANEPNSTIQPETIDYVRNSYKDRIAAVDDVSQSSIDTFISSVNNLVVKNNYTKDMVIAKYPEISEYIKQYASNTLQADRFGLHNHDILDMFQEYLPSKAVSTVWNNGSVEERMSILATADVSTFDMVRLQRSKFSALPSDIKGTIVNRYNSLVKNRNINTLFTNDRLATYKNLYDDNKPLGVIKSENVVVYIDKRNGKYKISVRGAVNYTTKPYDSLLSAKNAFNKKLAGNNRPTEITDELITKVNNVSETNQQEIENETQQTGRVEDGNPSADTRTQDENGTDTVGNNKRADVGPREVLSESGRGNSAGSQTSGNEATNRPMGGTQAENNGSQTQSVRLTTYPNNLTRQERAAIAEVAQYEGVPVDTVYQAIADGNINFFTGTGATSGADVSAMARELVNQDIADNVVKAENLISRLTTAPATKKNTPSGNSLVDDYFTQNPKDKTELENYLARTRRSLEQAVNTELDKQADYADRNDYTRAEQAYKQAAQYQQELKALPANAVEMVNAYLTDGVALEDAVNQTVNSTRPVANGFTFDSLPQGIKDILNKIWNSLKHTVAAVSMALAIYAGSNFVVPNEVMAATPVETATVQHVVQTNDNQGKSFIVADKQAGTLTVYNAAGQELTSTPALFGKTVGDSITTRNTTPSGRYDLTRATNINNSAYGNSAQVLTVNGQMQANNAGNLAIHRVLTSFPSENRVGRLDSATASDNRISHGCINVPASFYDAHLDNVGDAVVYVLPETDAGRTGVFSVNVPTTVEPQMDNANAQSVEVKPSDIQSAPTTYSEPRQAPAKALAPVTIAGTQPSGQVAYVAPVVVGGISADQINIPFDVHTPAELQANSAFDTEPVSDSLRSDDGNGFNIYEIAAWLAGIGATAKVISKRRKKKLVSKKHNEQPTSDNANEETVTSEQNPSGTDRNEQAQATVDDNHNDKVNQSANHVVKNAPAQPQKDPLTDAVTRALWLEYIANSHLTIAKDESGNMVEGGDVYSAFMDSMLGFGWAIDDVMRDRTIEQANDNTFTDPLKWRNEISDKGRAGVSAKLMNWAAGVTQAFDNLMTEHGIARVGHEMDSSIPSKHLAQIKAKANGAYAQIHKLYVKPLVSKVDILAGNLRMGFVELEQDIGRVATVKHVLNEAADAMWRGREHIIRTHQEQLDAVNAAIANTAEGNEVRFTLTNKARLLQNEIQSQTELLNKARDMYNGVIPWDGKTGLPGGYTKAQAEKTLADLKAKYGSNFSQVEQLSTETVQTIRGIRNLAAAGGVFSNADLQTFHDLGFTEYVPLYAEQEDPLEVDETDTYTKQSIMDKLMADLPAQEARAMGLTKDLSRYHREGATSPAADAFTNMKVFSMNMAGRIGQQGWLNSVQQLYEGTVGKPISATHITDEETLKELNTSPDSGKLPGLIRVRPGMEQFAGIDTKKLKPIMAKGHNSAGEVVTYHYYFTEPTIQEEIYSNADLTETLVAKGLRNVGTLTRLAARMMTTFKPVWNVYNWARDSLERISIMLMRPVKDKDGNLVNKWDLSKSYFGHLATMAASPMAQTEIYRYLILGETQTKLQKILHEAVGEGAINLITSQTEKHSIMADLNKSTIDKLASQATNMLGAGFNKTGAGKLKRGADQLLDMYIMRLTEVPQVTTALASYMAYQDMGVNKGETANRVRDQYDPTRANNKAINSTSQLYPFIRSTFSGHYNLGRTLSEYWKPGTWQAPLAYMVVGTLGTMAVLTMMAGLFGDDDDGVPKIARLPIGTLMNGVPVPVGDGGVWSLPVGFGMNKLSWGIGANLWRQSMGMQSGEDTAKQLMGLVVDNTSPMQVASGNVMSENPVTGMALTFTPLLAKPLMEIATNTKSFGGAKIINRETPKDQYDSDQDNFNTPETYKTWARALRETTGIDMRPETMRHLIESYSWGMLGAFPKSVIQDQSDKTLGNVQRKGEVFGPLITAIGADMAIQPNALDYAQHTYAMNELRMELHKRYGVGETHSEEVYEQYADRGKRGGVIKRADVVTERAMRDKGVPEHVIQYVVNGMRYNKARQEANKNFTELSQKYYELRQQGKDDPVMRMAVQSAWDKLEDLTYNYVKENNRAYFEIMQQQ